MLAASVDDEQVRTSTGSQRMHKIVSLMYRLLCRLNLNLLKSSRKRR